MESHAHTERGMQTSKVMSESICKALRTSRGSAHVDGTEGEGVVFRRGHVTPPFLFS